MEQAQQILQELEAAGRIMLVSYICHIVYTNLKLVLNIYFKRHYIITRLPIGITFTCVK